MAIPEKTLQKRAVKKGVKVSKKLGHPVTPEELRSLRVQVMPAWPRVLLIVAGSGLLAMCWRAWPWDSNLIRIVEAIMGIFSLLFGFFGVRRTLAEVAEHASGDFIEVVVELVGEAISNIDI